MQSIEQHEEYCAKCDDYHNPLVACVMTTKKIAEIDWLKLQKEFEKTNNQRKGR